MIKPRYFFDTNTLLEILLARKNQQAVINALTQHQDNNCISALSVHLIVYFGSKYWSLDVINEFLSDYTILSLNDNNVEWAFSNTRNDDFEDALQLAVAISNGCQKFITLDKKLVSTYKSLPTIDTVLLS